MTRKIHLLIALLILSSGFLIAENHSEAAPEAAPEAAAEAAKDEKFTYRPFSEELDPGYNIEEHLSPHRTVFLEYIVQPDNEPEDINDATFDLYEIRYGFGHEFKAGDNLYVGLEFTHNIYSVDQDIGFDVNDVAGDDDSRTFHAIDLEYSVAYKKEKLMFKVYGSSGLHSDLRGVESQDVKHEGGAEIGYMVSPTLAIIAGAFYYERLEEWRVFPYGGFVWKPLDTGFEASVIMPLEAKLTYRYSRNFELLTFYELDWNDFRFRFRDAAGVEDEDDFIFRTYRVGIGLNYYFTSDFYFNATLGGTLDGKLNFEERDDLDTDIEGGTFFLLIGFTLNSSALGH